MGKIYDDIINSVSNESTKALLDNLFSVGNIVQPRIGLRYRENEINRIYNIMDKAEYRSVLLVGDFGSGKRSIVAGYVDKLEQNMRSDVVVEIDFTELIKKSQTEDFIKVLNDIFYISSHNENFEIVILLNNFGHILNLNCFGNTGFATINSIIKHIEENNIRIIATATTDEFKTLEDCFKKSIDYFNIIKLTDLTKDQTVDVINDIKSRYQQMYNINFPENISELICTNADKYIKTKSFPGKAEWLFDEVCSAISNKFRPVEQSYIDNVENIYNLKNQLQESFTNNDFVRCQELEQEISRLDAEIEAYRNTEFPYIDAQENDILEAIGKIFDIPLTKLSSDKIQFLKEMPIELKKNVIGQDPTIDMIVKNIRRNQLGLRKTSHSAGNFMFIGSTGVGKTYLAKQLAKYLYGSEDNLLRLDMSEFQSEIDVSKLLGSAPGYVGYKESGVLVRGLAKKPETVVLFDEIEKAHPKIYDVLLQLLDEGFVTGSDGKKVDATKSLIIFTSNIGVKQAMEMANPLGFSNDNVDEKKNERKEKTIRKALKNRFSPEFLNRLDNICYFNSLDNDTMKTILHKELEETNVGIKNVSGKIVELSPEAEEWILKKVEKEDNGARPIIRTLQQHIEELVADMVIDEDEIINSDREILIAEVENDKIVLR